METCISNLLLEYIFSLIFTREFIVARVWAGGTRATPLLLAAHFAKRNTKFGGGKRGRAKIPSPNPLHFCPPERSVWRAKRAVSSVQKRFGFRQTNAPVLNFQDFCRLIQSREARKGMETLARRARRGSPSAGSKSLAILSICFVQ
jgi:hypothetical protein